MDMRNEQADEPLKQMTRVWLISRPSLLTARLPETADQQVSSQCLGRFMAPCQEQLLKTLCSGAHFAQRSSCVERHTFTPASYRDAQRSGNVTVCSNRINCYALATGEDLVGRSSTS